MALAEDTAGPTSFPKTVKVGRNMFGVTMSDEHHGLWASVDRPRITGQLFVWGWSGLRGKEQRQQEHQVTLSGHHVSRQLINKQKRHTGNMLVGTCQPSTWEDLVSYSAWSQSSPIYALVSLTINLKSAKQNDSLDCLPPDIRGLFISGTF